MDETGTSPYSSILNTRICKLCGIQYPIIQTGMGWVSDANLTAATSSAGGLGIIASATMSYQELCSQVHRVKELTDKPFGVNMRADQEDIIKRIDLLISEGVKVASFAQAPKRNLIDKLKSAGLVTIPTIGARRHAEKVAGWGVDAVIAQGHEGGGHTGPVPTSILLPEVCDAVDIPVLGAGGFRDGRGLIAALSYGAEGIAMGTRFLLTQESPVPNHIKKRYLKTQTNGTVVTKSIDGYPQRVIRTTLIDNLEKSSWMTRVIRSIYYALTFQRETQSSFFSLLKEGLQLKQAQGLTWGQMLMAANAPMLTKASLVNGAEEVGILPTGQIVGLIEELPSATEVVAQIMREATQTLMRLQLQPKGPTDAP